MGYDEAFARIEAERQRIAKIDAAFASVRVPPASTQRARSADPWTAAFAGLVNEQRQQRRDADLRHGERVLSELRALYSSPEWQAKQRKTAAWLAQMGAQPGVAARTAGRFIGIAPPGWRSPASR